MPTSQQESGQDASLALYLAGVASAAFLVLYVCRLCPSLSLNGDSAELVTAAAVWGVPHAPGYPLFTALAHLFTCFPLGDIAWRVHLTSALFHAAAVGSTVLATHAITRSWIASLAAGCALGLERSFMLGSLYAEVFPLNDLFFALLLLLALRVRARAASPLAFVFVAGLAAAHHMMIALAAPSLAVLTLHPLVAFGRRRPFALALAFALPVVLAYALVPLSAARDPALSWGDVHDLSSFLSLVSRSDYGGLWSSVHGAGSGTGRSRLSALASVLANGFGAVTLIFAAIGAAVLLVRQRVVAVSLVLGAIVSGPLFAWRNALDTGTEETLAFFERFTTMCTIPIAIAVGAGIAATARALPAFRGSRIAGSIAFGLWAASSFLRVRDIDMSHDARGIAFAHDLVLRTPDRSLLLLSGDAPGSAALYVCAVERLCQGRVALSPGTLFMPWAMAQARRRYPDIDIPWNEGPALRHTHELVAAEAPKRPVFAYPTLLEKDPVLASAFTPLPDGLLFRIWLPESDATAQSDSFFASARSTATGVGCEGCVLLPPAWHPTQEMQLVSAYRAASLNHAWVAQRFPVDDRVRELIPALLARGGK